ncbi:hypothetical protein [Ornithinimicrobium kibberense]|uniref:hypothetical protein n=1 Tax=Ornithinimicrobium kibberense TaxID=282060 RepID=UPI00361A8630
MGDAHRLALGEREHPVDVTLGVDDEGDLAVVDQVAAVAQRRGLDGQHGGSGHGSSWGVVGGHLAFRDGTGYPRGYGEHDRPGR